MEKSAFLVIKLTANDAPWAKLVYESIEEYSKLKLRRGSNVEVYQDQV